MASTVPLLRRETTRTLCDQFTTLYDRADSFPSVSTQALGPEPSSSFGSPSPDSSDSELAARAVKYVRPTMSAVPPVVTSLPDALPSPASTVFTPASTPCSESDDSAVLDTLSPPSSPWFPTALDLSGKGPAQSDLFNLIQDNSSSSSNCSDSARYQSSDLDFFNNSFYQSLAEVPPHRPHPYFVSQRTASVSVAVRSAKAKRSLPENCRTAAPSDLFNVTIDEILSADPLNLRDLDLLDDSGSELSDAPSSSSSDTDSVLMSSELVSDSQASMGSQDIWTGANEQEMEELDTDTDDQREKRVFLKPTTGRKKVSSAPTHRQSTLKAPRVRRQVKRTPKVYPQRKPKGPAGRDDEQSTCSSSSDSIPLSASPTSTASPTDPSPSTSCGSRTMDVKKISTFTVMPADDGSYVCELCPDERFGRVHDLKRHQISKHNEKTWPCDFCHRPFVRRDALLRHYAVKAARRDGVHPTAQETHRLSEARARARLIC
ncbi:hypothetical protein BGZ54_010372 [Gamsiella multidivaricata]|nr:hypothetical protein BGZ54_010372 [Gamsiella multidivaricata]